MKDFFKKKLMLVAQYSFPIITIVMGIYTGFTAEKRTSEELLQSIVTMLSLIAGTLLIEKFLQLSSIEKRVKKIESKMADSDLFMYCHASKFWADALSSAQSLFISGGSLFHVIPEKSGDFDVLLRNGCRIEVVVVKPFSDAAEMLHRNVVKEIVSPEQFSENTIQTLEFLLEHKKAFPDQLTIRLNDHTPAFGIFAVYRDGTPRRIQANLFSEKVPYDKRLALNLEASSEKNRFAYDYFCKQIESLEKRLPECSLEDLEKVVHSRAASFKKRAQAKP